MPMSGTRLADWNAFGVWVWASLQGLDGITPIATSAVAVVSYMTYRHRSYEICGRTTIKLRRTNELSGEHEPSSQELPAY